VHGKAQPANASTADGMHYRDHDNTG
jgi:hypothetical protein